MRFPFTEIRRAEMPRLHDHVINRSEHYEGRAGMWDSKEAREVQKELLEYFGGEDGFDLPTPPRGLPGRNGDAYSEVMALLNIGLRYYAACVSERPGRQWTIHNDVEEILRAAYKRGADDRQSEFDRVLEKRFEQEQADYRAREHDFPSEESRFAYFIGGEEGPIKIGVARNPEKRLRALQTGHHQRLAILATVAGGIDREAEYHSRFSEHRLTGEWFARAPEILAEVARLSPREAVS